MAKILQNIMGIRLYSVQISPVVNLQFWTVVNRERGQHLHGIGCAPVFLCRPTYALLFAGSVQPRPVNRYVSGSILVAVTWQVLNAAGPHAASGLWAAGVMVVGALTVLVVLLGLMGWVATSDSASEAG